VCSSDLLDSAHRSEEPPGALSLALETGLRRVVYGREAQGDPAGGAWAHLPLHRSPEWLPISALDPEAPEARAYEGFAQAVLAAGARPGSAPYA
jgi:hypothetical protein